jgi:NhaA family Na+:H+ antiporter
MNRLGVRTVVGYIIVGTWVWLCTLKSGIHPTISGVVLGLLTPATALISRQHLTKRLVSAIEAIGSQDTSDETVKTREILEDVDFTSRESISPLERFETYVHPWSAFVIMPIFALANAGVSFSAEAMTSTVSTAVALALLTGKPLGIVLCLLLVVKLGYGIMPGGAGWRAVVGGGCLAGIGFTMSLFVASLGLEGELLEQAKAGILMGSAVAGTLGFVLLVTSLKQNPSQAEDAV